MKDNSFSIHEKNIQSLAIEIYKFLNGLSPSFLNNVFHKNISNSYDLRNHKEIYSRNPKTVRYGTETVRCMVPKIWSKVPGTILSLECSSLESLNQKYTNSNQNAIPAFVQHICPMMMMMMMNCFCGKVNRRNTFRLISSRDHCQRSSPWRIVDTLRAECEPVHNLNSGLVE